MPVITSSLSVMSSLVRAIWELTAGGFRRHSRYRLAILTSMVANITFGLIRASVLVGAMTTAGAPIAGYDRLAAVTYVWVGQALIGPIDIWGGSASELGRRIKEGGLVTDLLRPSAPLLQWVFPEVGRAGSQLLPRFVPMLLIGALLTGIRLPNQPLDYLLFMLSLSLAVVLSYCIWAMINLLALWVVEIRGYTIAGMVIINLMSGFLIPVQWFPPWLKAIADHSPFPSMYQAPTDLLTGLAEGRIGTLLATQFGWMVAALIGCWLMLRAGSKRMEVQGG